ncbi:thioredoxin family protein [Pirellulaceae bacterium SH449]
MNGLFVQWSLTEFIAGLLDKRRERTTSLSGSSRAVVAMLSACLSAVLLLNFRCDLLNAASLEAQPPSAQEQSFTTDPKDNIRGAGDQLEFRLRGRLLSTIEQPLINPSVTVGTSNNELSYAATVVGDQYEVWVPANSFKWFRLSLEGKSEDGRRAVVSLDRSGLRKSISEGVDIVLQQPNRSVKIIVKHNDKPVPNAQVKAIANGILFVKTDANGQAMLKLGANYNISMFTAWTESGLLGGYQFYQSPPRDQNANEHVIELLECRNRQIRVIDTDGSPVAGVRLKLQVATPKHYNYFGNPTDCEVITDVTGTAIYKWFPKLEDAHHYAELIGEQDWRLHSQSNTDDAVKVIVTKPAARVRVEGQVSRGGQYVGGVVVEARSFQGETEGHSDVRTVIADREGNFSFDALPNSTYAMYVMDDEWVSEPQVFIPIDPVTGAKRSPYLMALDGHTVTVLLTSGPNRKPIAGQSVSFVSEYDYSWKENGERQYGVTHRQIFATTDEQGVAKAMVPLGSLRASVYTSSWRTESTIDVVAGKVNQVELHRNQDTVIHVKGRIELPPFNSTDLKKVSVAIQAIDGQVSEEFTPAVSESGQFSFDTKASMVGCFAYSADGQWAAVKVVEGLHQPFTIELQPTAYLSGRLLDGEGKPIANHRVSANPRLENRTMESSSSGFSRSMKGKSITTETDADGNYRIGPLPRQIEIGLWCDATNPTEYNGRKFLGNYFIELDEQRPPQVHRLGSEPSVPSKLAIEERFAEVLRDARLGSFHTMIILADTTEERCNSFVQENLLNYDANIQVANYMQMRFNTGASGSEQSKAFVKTKNWPIPTEGNVVAIALDAMGNELGQTTIDISADDANDQVVRFIEKHSPPVVDASQKWSEAFALAKKTNRRVWVRISQRYCGPCFQLNRWLDDHRAVLEKEFVLLKIDDVRDDHGMEIAKEITGDKPFGVPFFAFYDADQKLLIDSVGPTGNIGSISGYEGKRHFRRMLQKVRQTLSEAEIEQVVGSIQD